MFELFSHTFHMPFICLLLVVMNKLYLFAFIWLHFYFIYFGISTNTFHDKHNQRSFGRSHLFLHVQSEQLGFVATFCAPHEISFFSQQYSKMYLPIREIIVKVYFKVLESLKSLKQ